MFRVYCYAVLRYYANPVLSVLVDVDVSVDVDVYTARRWPVL